MSTLRIVLQSRIYGNEIRNIFYFAGAFAEVANAQAIVDYMREAYLQGTTTLASRLSQDIELYAATVKDVSDAANPTIPVLFTLGPLQGSGTTDPLPLQTAMMVTFRSLTAPPNQSRRYLCGMVEDIHDGQTGWTGSAVSAALDWGNYLLDIATNLDPGIAMTVTRINAGVLVGSNILDSVTVTPYARTQRRRTPGRGI